MFWLYHKTETLIKTIIRFCIVGIRPLLGPATCRFEVGCTKYAVEALKNESLVKAIWLIMRRVASCNPF